MVLIFIRRYWITIIGAAAIAGFVGASVLWLAGWTVDSLVEISAKSRGANFAAALEQRGGDVEAFMTGLSRDPDFESDMRRIANMSGIESFSVFDVAGTDIFSTRSDRYSWLLRDRPGGMRLGDRLTASVMDRPGRWELVTDDGTGNPSVVVPLERGEKRIGYVSVVSDIEADRASYREALTQASVILLGVLTLACGVPLLIFLQRRHKIDEADARIEFLATKDTLTHLLNRGKMQEETDRILSTVRATREPMAYFYLDLNRLGEINDACGQAAGDEVLRIVAGRVAGCVGRGDLVARIGPDDFAILKRNTQSAEQLAAFARLLKKTVCQPVVLRERTVMPSISLGCATVSSEARTHSELVKRAELAHFHHKTRSDEDFVLFEASMDEEMHRQRAIEAMVKDAIDKDGFELFYQPIVCGATARLLGFEALIRLKDGAGGHVSPAVFIPIAERRGLIKTIGTWVIEEATRQISLWPEHLFVAVNLSAVQFRDRDLVGIVRGALEKNGLTGNRLEVEIVESLVLDRNDAILDQLSGLRSLGVSIDMDDFGTGYSSLGYLWRFQFDKLKIDQSFMMALESGEANVPQIVSTIVSLAHGMKMKVTAEGVETQKQADFLRQIGCDQIQGFRFGRPGPAAVVEAQFLRPTEAHAFLRQPPETVALLAS
ncbi:bifunctional diguanylate cyclase/phosphodiesterase [Aurantimonas sp. Leaf443]|uniref:putative bifunctional diguanylate cyclase/phosphodiesterase n=1 Tax=Aurantimonas sp. Leaf443 TaxID=1736378 RepID=UPI0009E9650F|nr:bifunctional diguanylate cyclase/phosphodiesterase [Aurantimonas sp. Leaf443]